MHAFKATDTLVEVHRHIMLHQPGANTPFMLMTTFPKQIFNASDMGRTLKDLGKQPPLDGVNFVLSSSITALCESDVVTRLRTQI